MKKVMLVLSIVLSLTLGMLASCQHEIHAEPGQEPEQERQDIALLNALSLSGGNFQVSSAPELSELGTKDVRTYGNDEFYAYFKEDNETPSILEIRDEETSNDANEELSASELKEIAHDYYHKLNEHSDALDLQISLAHDEGPLKNIQVEEMEEGLPTGIKGSFTLRQDGKLFLAVLYDEEVNPENLAGMKEKGLSEAEALGIVQDALPELKLLDGLEYDPLWKEVEASLLPENGSYIWQVQLPLEISSEPYQGTSQGLTFFLDAITGEVSEVASSF